jgi:uncharacterized protein YbjT (DUF2867 family)
MVAPRDLRVVAARLLQEPARETKIHAVEGPERYTPGDVATAFARALDRVVKVEVTPRERWEETFRGLGFSEKAARSYARMTEVTVDEPMLPASPIRGDTSLMDYAVSAAR